MVRIIGKIVILMVVLGFFMPVVSLPLLGYQSGFELAKYVPNISNLVSDADRTREVENVTNLATFVYISFISALVSSLLIIPLIMRKRIHVLFDLVFWAISSTCCFLVYSDIKDYVTFQIGGQFIFIGLIASLVLILITLLEYILNEN